MRNRRWTLVTGASSGIGLELARCFAADGDSVLLVARRKDRLEALAAELAQAHHVETRALAFDLAEPAAPENLLEAVAALGIPVHTLVNNAGFGLRGRFATLPAERQLAMVQLNVMALTALSRLFLPRMIESRSGGILNVASTAAFQAGPFMAVYYATKAYVLSLSEALHEEAKPYNVTVSVLCPGPTPTEFQSIADMEGIRLNLLMKPTAEVARAGLEGYRAGRAIIIPGAANRAGALASRLLPKAMTRRVAGSLQKVER
jgi:short-subunit dehydrogenase